jgi:cellobiose dehydrogenase (acceptor)
MISRPQWIDLPVGYNLMDHLNTDLIVAHPNVSFYDFYASFNSPIESDKVQYLVNRTGVLASAAPNIGPMVRADSDAASGGMCKLTLLRSGTRSWAQMGLCASSSGRRG